MADAGSVLEASEQAAEEEAERQWYGLTWPPDRQDAQTAGGAIGAAAATAACVSAGAGLASPLCGAVGAWLGETLGGLIYDVGAELIDAFGGFGGVGSGHPFGHFTLYAYRSGVALEIFDGPYDAEKVREYLRSIGIDLQISSGDLYYYPDAYRQYGYANLREAQLAAAQRGEPIIDPGARVRCPSYQGVVRVDGKVVFSNVCTERSYNPVGNEVWWNDVTRVMLARMAAVAASSKIVTRIDPRITELAMVRRPSSAKTLITGAAVVTGVVLLWKVFA